METAAIRYFTYQIPDSDHPVLCVPFTLNDLADAATRAPKQSSPGIDSIPYAIIQLLLTHTSTAAVALRVYSDALLHGLFPQSWQVICLVLLPKKGGLSQLKNWRPISLICCDAKIFTRLLNARLMEHFRTRLSSSQSGFMPHMHPGSPALERQVSLHGMIRPRLVSLHISATLSVRRVFNEFHISTTY